MGNPVVHFEIVARDFEKLRAFYQELFGWEIGEPNEWNWAPLRTGSERGIPGGMSRVPDAPLGGARTYFYVEVDDLQATLDKVQRMGGKTLVPPWDEVGLAIFQDPEGNRVGLLRAKR